MDIAGLVTLAIGIFGVAGVVFTALRFRRDDTTQVVTQQSTILDNMHTLNDELRTTNADLKEQVEKLTEQVKQMRQELAKYVETVEP